MQQDFLAESEAGAETSADAVPAAEEEVGCPGNVTCGTPPTSQGSKPLMPLETHEKRHSEGLA